MPDEKRSMQEFIARENVNRWTAILAGSTDELEANTLRRLIQSEKQHLQELREEASVAASKPDRSYRSHGPGSASGGHSGGQGLS